MEKSDDTIDKQNNLLRRTHTIVELESFQQDFIEAESCFNMLDVSIRKTASLDEKKAFFDSDVILPKLEETRKMMESIKASKDLQSLKMLHGKLFTLETLAIEFIPKSVLLSNLRDASMQGLAMCSGSQSEPSFKDNIYFKEVLDYISKPEELTDEQMRQTYLQVRQRVISVKSNRFTIAIMSDRFISILIKRTTIAVSFLLVPIIVFLLLRYIPLGTTEHEGYKETVYFIGSGEYALEGIGKMISRITTISVVALAGIIGAFVSNFARVRTLLTEISAQSTNISDRYFRVKQSPLIGGILALLLAEIFGAKLIQGDLFPMTEYMPRWTDLIWHGGAFSKLIVWGFIAGLSESSIMNLIGKLTNKLIGKFDNK